MRGFSIYWVVSIPVQTPSVLIQTKASVWFNPENKRDLFVSFEPLSRNGSIGAPSIKNLERFLCKFSVVDVTFHPVCLHIVR